VRRRKRGLRQLGAVGEGAQSGGDVESDAEDGLAVGLVEAGEGPAGVGGLELGGGQGLGGPVAVGEGRSVEAVQLVVQDAGEGDGDRDGPRSHRGGEGEDDAFGRLVERDGGGHHGAVDQDLGRSGGQFGAVQGDGGDRLMGRGFDADVAREGGRLEVGGQA
jgi:hypothetical protein